MKHMLMLLLCVSLVSATSDWSTGGDWGCGGDWSCSTTTTTTTTTTTAAGGGGGGGGVTTTTSSTGTTLPGEVEGPVISLLEWLLGEDGTRDLIAFLDGDVWCAQRELPGIGVFCLKHWMWFLPSLALTLYYLILILKVKLSKKRGGIVRLPGGKTIR